jgi:hypothetical protein
MARSASDKQVASGLIPITFQTVRSSSRQPDKFEFSPRSARSFSCTWMYRSDLGGVELDGSGSGGRIICGADVRDHWILSPVFCSSYLPDHSADAVPLCGLGQYLRATRRFVVGFSAPAPSSALRQGRRRPFHRRPWIRLVAHRLDEPLPQFSDRLPVRSRPGSIRELVFLNRFDMIVSGRFRHRPFRLGAPAQLALADLGTSGAQIFVWGFFVSTSVLLHGTLFINCWAHDQWK